MISVFVLMGQSKMWRLSESESAEAHYEAENEMAGGDAVAAMALQLAPEKTVDALTRALHAELNREGVQRGNRLSSVQAPRTPNQLADAFDKGTVGVVFLWSWAPSRRYGSGSWSQSHLSLAPASSMPVVI